MNFQRVVVSILVAGAVVIAVYAGWHYAALLREREALRTRLTETQQSLAEVERARAQVEADLVTAQNTLQATLAEKATLTNQVAYLDEKAGRLEQEAAKAAQAREALEQTNAALQAQVADLTAQRNTLDARLHSLDELKAAMQTLKRRLSEATSPAPSAATTSLHSRAARPDRAVDGNRGYVIQAGAPTIGPSRFRVRVLPYGPVGGTPPPTASAPTQPLAANQPQAGVPSARPASK